MNGNSSSGTASSTLSKINSFLGDLNKLAVEWYDRIKGGPSPATAAGVPSRPAAQTAPERRIDLVPIFLGVVISVALTLVVTRFIGK